MESPLLFQEMAGYTALSAILDKRIIFQKGYFRWDTAIYSMIVGPAGIGKSSALDECLRFITEDLDKQKSLVVGMSSARALMNGIQAMGAGLSITPAIIAPDEAKNFFALSAEDMVGFLVENYNNNKDFVYKTANYGEVLINNPYVVFSGNSTIEWIEGNFKDELLNGGFGRRCLFVYGDKKSRSNPDPEVSFEMEIAREKCVSRLREIKTMIEGYQNKDTFGKFEITPEAKEWYMNWYVENDKKSHGILHNYFVEKRVHLHKYAMLYSLAYKNELILDLKDFLGANEFLTRVEASMGKVFRSTGKNMSLGLSNDIMDFLNNKGKVEKGLIYKQFFKDADMKMVAMALEGLVSCGELKMSFEGTVCSYER